MNNKYLVRAKLEYDWLGAHPSKVPIAIGPFILDQSPNINLDAWNRRYYDPSIDDDLPKENNDYPVSNLYIDCIIQVSEKQSPLNVADYVLNDLEILFRLFQSGRVYISRHKVRLIEDGKKCEQFISTLGLPTPRRPRPKPAPFNGSIGYDLDEIRIMLNFPIGISSEYGYDLSDAKLVKLKDFFGLFWEIIQSKRQPLDVAINRFNSSYEKQTLADKLIDLMIAMEALLGSHAEVTYKISLRFACMLYPPGEAREKAFYAVKKVYEERSNIIHGERLDTKFSEEEVHNFEEHVRKLIVKFLELCKKGIILNDKNIDKFIFLGNIAS